MVLRLAELLTRHRIVKCFDTKKIINFGELPKKRQLDSYFSLSIVKWLKFLLFAASRKLGSITSGIITLFFLDQQNFGGGILASAWQKTTEKHMWPVEKWHQRGDDELAYRPKS